MTKNAEAKQKPIQRLFEYAGNFKYLTIASWVLAVISAFAALVPFYFIWCLIKEVLRVASDYWSSSEFGILWMERCRNSGACHADLHRSIDLLASVCIPRARQYAARSLCVIFYPFRLVLWKKRGVVKFGKL